MSWYTKLFSSIVTSSVWGEDSDTRVVWVTMLALKDQRHIVNASLPGLARVAGVSVKKCAEAIAKFEAPDPDSSNSDNEGRKIAKVEGGWLVLNGEMYQRKMSEDDRAEYQRKKQAEYRGKRKVAAKKVSGTTTMAERIINDPALPESYKERMQEIEDARVSMMAKEEAI